MVHHELGLAISISSPENASQMCSQASLMEPVLLLRFSLLWSVQLLVKLVKTKYDRYYCIALGIESNIDVTDNGMQLICKYYAILCKGIGKLYNLVSVGVRRSNIQSSTITRNGC